MPMLMTLRMRLPVWPFQSPLRTRSAKSAILSSTAWTSGTTLRPSMNDRRAARRAQRDVQHRALLGDVDLVAAEHRLDALAQPGLLGQLQQQPQGLVGDPVLRIVEIDAGRLDREPLAALRGHRRTVAAGGRPSSSDNAVSSAAQAGRLRNGGMLVDCCFATSCAAIATLTGCNCHPLSARLAHSRALALRCRPSGRSTISRTTPRPRPAAARPERIDVDARLGEAGQHRLAIAAVRRAASRRPRRDRRKP